jgi:anti-anti-sigma factor
VAVKVVTYNNLEIAVIELRGSLIGGDETDDLKKRAHDLIEQGNRKLIIDLERVEYINSPGIGTLVHIFTLYKEHKGNVKLCNLGRNVLNTFVITKLISVFDIEESKKQAIQRFESNVV